MMKTNGKHKILVFYIHGGGGHISVARSIEHILTETYDWDVILVDMNSLLVEFDFLKKYTGYLATDVYNLSIKTGRALTCFYTLYFNMVKATTNAIHSKATSKVADFIKTVNPDIVVSVTPYINRILHESITLSKSHAELMTILTDFTIIKSPANYWIEHQDQFLICPTGSSYRRAICSKGVQPSKIFKVSGIIIHPSFYTVKIGDKKEERRKLGLSPDLPTCILQFGAYGNRNMIDIAKEIDRSKLPIQMIVICGRNQELYNRFRHTQFNMPVYIEGYTNNITYYMALADFYIGKSGAISISEAMNMKLPCLMEMNRTTIPIEIGNTRWVLRNRFGLTFSGAGQIVTRVRQLLDQIDLYRTKLADYRNRAIFETAEIMNHILNP